MINIFFFFFACELPSMLQHSNICNKNHHCGNYNVGTLYLCNSLDSYIVQMIHYSQPHFMCSRNIFTVIITYMNVPLNHYFFYLLELFYQQLFVYREYMYKLARERNSVEKYSHRVHQKCTNVINVLLITFFFFFALNTVFFSSVLKLIFLYSNVQKLSRGGGGG